MKSTKKSFLMSLVSLMLCFAMLLGTTYAWFTDEVTSGTNKIIAGNLDVELLHQGKNDSQAADVSGETKLFDDITLWEPGAYVYETFTVKNVGNLALKYSMALNVASYTSYNGHDLTEVLKVKVVDTAPESRPSYTDGVALKTWSLNSANQPLYPVGNVPTGGASSKTFTVVIYWEPTDHDNDFNMNNGRPQPLSVDLGVKLVATQVEHEFDSFNNQYDKDLDNTLPPVTKEEYQLFANMSGTIDEDLKVEKQGIFEEATVPAAIANSIFNNMMKTGESGDTVENNLTVFLNVDETAKTVDEESGSYSYDIDMTAVMESIINGTKTTKEEAINNLSDFVEIKLAIESGFTSIGVKHDGNAMTSVANKDAATACTPENENGYFNYDKATGILTLWTKSFSPFAVEAVREPDPTEIHNEEELRAFAAGTLADKNDNTKFAKFGIIVADITMAADAEVSFSRTATLDLGGHTIQGSRLKESGNQVYGIINCNGADCVLTIRDTIGDGKIINTASSNWITQNNSDQEIDYATPPCAVSVKNGKLIVNSGTLEATGIRGCGIYILSVPNATGQIVTINGGTISGGLCGINNNGYNYVENLRINGGTVTGYTGVFHFNGGFTMTGGTVTGANRAIWANMNKAASATQDGVNWYTINITGGSTIGSIAYTNVCQYTDSRNN